MVKLSGKEISEVTFLKATFISHKRKSIIPKVTMYLLGFWYLLFNADITLVIRQIA